jgi:hypothetical protein
MEVHHKQVRHNFRNSFAANLKCRYLISIDSRGLKMHQEFSLFGRKKTRVRLTGPEVDYVYYTVPTPGFS